MKTINKEEQREHYLNVHLFGCVNWLVKHLSETNGIDAPAYWQYDDDSDDYGMEICSWWIVSSNMASRLKKAGYCIVDFEEEVYFWGRTSHGIRISQEESLMEAIGI